MFKPQQSDVLGKQEIPDATTKALYDALVLKDSKPNVLTLDQFRQFEPLFRKNSELSEKTPENENTVMLLTEKFKDLVDFYKETQIVVSTLNPTVVLTLPAIFTPVKSFDHNDRNSSLVATNQAMSHNSVPRYQADAFNAMFTAFRNEQLKNKNTVVQYTQNYAKRVDEFFEKYSTKETNIKNSNTTVQTELPSLNNDDTTWDLD